MMKKLMFILLIQISATGAFACTPGAGNGPTGDPNCMGGVLSTDPYYNGSQRNSSSRPSKIIRHTVVNVPSKYGALAVNRETGISAGAINADSLQQAKKLAIQRCEKGGNAPCKVVSWVRNGCIAGAEGKLGTKWKSFYAGREQGQAEQTVMSQCNASGATDCKIVIPEGCSIP